MVGSVPRVYKVVKEGNVPAKMRDGVTLYADIYRPDAPGRFPVLLMRTPYNKAGFADVPEGLPRELNYVRDYAERFVPRGYVLVVQDTRSRFTSEGDLHYYPLIHEANDGYDTVEWAAQLPWANGKVGTGSRIWAPRNISWPRRGRPTCEPWCPFLPPPTGTRVGGIARAEP